MWKTLSLLDFLAAVSFTVVENYILNYISDNIKLVGGDNKNT